MLSHIYALYLLAQFREPAAYSRVVRYFRLPGELAVDATGDVATEDLDRVLASLHHGDLRPIHELITDFDASQWARGAGVRALQESVFSDQLPRDDAVPLLTGLFRGAIEREPSNVWNCLVSVATDLHGTELETDIRQAFASGLIDPFFITLEVLWLPRWHLSDVRPVGAWSRGLVVREDLVQGPNDPTDVTMTPSGRT